MPFFRDLLPSFCQTASKDYKYTIYVAYDTVDAILHDPKLRAAFTDTYYAYVISRPECSGLRKTQLVWHACNYTGEADVTRCVLAAGPNAGSPAWSQNDAVMMAYRNGADYIYRVNDDTQLLTPHWTRDFIKVSMPAAGHLVSGSCCSCCTTWSHETLE